MISLLNHHLQKGHSFLLTLELIGVSTSSPDLPLLWRYWQMLVIEHELAKASKLAARYYDSLLKDLA